MLTQDPLSYGNEYDQISTESIFTISGNFEDKLKNIANMEDIEFINFIMNGSIDNHITLENIGLLKDETSMRLNRIVNLGIISVENEKGYTIRSIMIKLSKIHSSLKIKQNKNNFSKNYEEILK